MMRLKLFGLTLLLTIFLSSRTMETPEIPKVTFPDAATLILRLKQIGQEHYLEHSGIVKELAGKTMPAANVIVALDRCSETYKNHFISQRADEQYLKMMITFHEKMKPHIHNAIFQDSPAMLDYLTASKK